MKGDLLLTVSYGTPITNDAIGDLSKLGEYGFEFMYVLNLPDGADVYLGNVAIEQLEKFHKDIHELLGIELEG